MNIDCGSYVCLDPVHRMRCSMFVCSWTICWFVTSRKRESGVACRGLSLITGSYVYVSGGKRKKKYTHLPLFCDKNLDKDTLSICLVYGLVGLVDVLHGDGVGELVEHSLLESLQPLVIVAAAHKLLILQGEQQKPASGRWGEFDL